jgi:deazaflavin-dependent oxidoreductase (nitroreductase family)
MKLIIFRLFTRLHVILYRLSGGAIGGNLPGVQILLLESMGRKTGKRRTTPLAYIRDGDNYVVTASNGGEPHHPGWYYNLHSQPQTVIQVIDQHISVEVEQANPEERRRLWAELVKRNPRFDEYQRKTSREIAMFILHPTNQ